MVCKSQTSAKNTKGTTIIKSFPEGTRLGKWHFMSISVTPAPLTLPPHCWISAYFDIRKGCESPVSTWISMAKDRTELSCRQSSSFVHARGSHQVARQHLFISRLHLHIPFVSHRRKTGGRRLEEHWKKLESLVMNKCWKEEIELTAREREGSGNEEWGRRYEATIIKYISTWSKLINFTVQCISEHIGF